jgi:hypothetical protein
MLDFRSARGRLWRLLGRAYRSPRGLHQPGFRRRGFRFDHDALPRNNGPRFLMRCALLLQPCSRVQAKAADPVLAPSGTLRAAYIGPNVAQARLDPNRHKFGCDRRHRARPASSGSLGTTLSANQFRLRATQYPYRWPGAAPASTPCPREGAGPCPPIACGGCASPDENGAAATLRAGH